MRALIVLLLFLSATTANQKVNEVTTPGIQESKEHIRKVCETMDSQAPVQGKFLFWDLMTGDVKEVSVDLSYENTLGLLYGFLFATLIITIIFLLFKAAIILYGLRLLRQEWDEMGGEVVQVLVIKRDKIRNRECDAEKSHLLIV